MKSSYPMASADRVKAKNQAVLKNVAAGNIAKSYMELLQLRGQVHELEAKQAFCEYGAGQSARKKARLTRSQQPGIN